MPFFNARNVHYVDSLDRGPGRRICFLRRAHPLSYHPNVLPFFYLFQAHHITVTRSNYSTVIVNMQPLVGTSIVAVRCPHPPTTQFNHHSLLALQVDVSDPSDCAIIASISQTTKVAAVVFRSTASLCNLSLTVKVSPPAQTSTCGYAPPAFLFCLQISGCFRGCLMLCGAGFEVHLPPLPSAAYGPGACACSSCCCAEYILFFLLGKRFDADVRHLLLVSVV